MRALRPLALVATAAVLAACSGAPTIAVQTQSGTTALVANNTDGGDDALLQGVVTIGDDGCLGIVGEGGTEQLPLVWPEGSTLADDGQSIDVPDIGRVGVGVTVAAAGGESAVAGNARYADLPDACTTTGRVWHSWRVTTGRR